MELFGFENRFFGVDAETALLGFGTANSTPTSGINNPPQKPNASDSAKNNPATKAPGFDSLNTKSAVETEDKEVKENDEAPRPPKLLTHAEAKKAKQEAFANLLKEVPQEHKSLLPQDDGEGSTKFQEAAKQVLAKLTKTLESKEEAVNKAQQQVTKEGQKKAQVLTQEQGALHQQKQKFQAALSRFTAAHNQLENTENNEMRQLASTFADGGESGQQKDVGSAYKTLLNQAMGQFGKEVKLPKADMSAADVNKFIKDKATTVLAHQKKEVDQAKQALKSAQTPQEKQQAEKTLKEVQTQYRKIQANNQKLEGILHVLARVAQAQKDPVLRKLYFTPVLKGQAIVDMEPELAWAYMKAYDEAAVKEGNEPVYGTTSQALTSADSESETPVAPQSSPTPSGFGVQSAGSGGSSSAQLVDSTGSVESNFFLEIEEASVAGEQAGTFGIASASGTSGFAPATANELANFVATSAVNFNIQGNFTKAKAQKYKTDQMLKKVMAAIMNGNSDLITFALMLMTQKDQQLLQKIAFVGVNVFDLNLKQTDAMSNEVVKLNMKDAQSSAKLQGFVTKIQSANMGSQTAMELIRMARSEVDKGENFLQGYIARVTQQGIQLARWG